MTEAHVPADSAELLRTIDELVQANRAGRRGEIELRLRNLRHQAGLALQGGAGRPDWPPAYADPFPEVSGRPPEIAATELTTEVMGGAVAHHGGLIVRGAYDRARVEATIAAVDRARAGWEAHGSDPSGGDEWYQPLVLVPEGQSRMLRKMVAGQGGLWLGDSPACTELVLGDLEAVGIVPAIAAHFGERPFFSLQKSTLRRSEPNPEFHLAAWHQDGSFLTAGVRTMNAWVALSRCGGDYPAPGLEVVPRRVPQIYPVDGVLSPHSISFDLIAELAVETPTMMPEFWPGDAFLFDERLVHRTHTTPSMREVRYAIECWFFAPSHPSTAYEPLLV